MKKFILFIVLLFSFFTFSAFCQLADHVVIAEIYAGGGNGGAPYLYDYIVLYNPTGSSVDVSGWSVQYSATSSVAPSWSKVDLVGSIPAGAYYLIQLNGGGFVGIPLPYHPDVVGNISLKKSVGKVALVNYDTLHTVDPILSNVIDFVGYGTADLWEGSSRWTSTLGDRKGIRRKTNSNTEDYNYGSDGSGWDSDNNLADFYSQNRLLRIINQPLSTSPLANHVVIAEVYGDGGGLYQYDYVVLYNPTADTYDLSTWSLQYFNGATWDVEILSGSIAPDAYYLIQLYDGGSGNPLPVTPDVIGSTNIDATDGEVALLRSTTTIPAGNATPLLTINQEDIVDFIGYGSVSGYEGAAGVGGPASSPLTGSIIRNDNSGGNTYGTNGSGWDLNDNSGNFYSESSPSPLPVELTSFSASIIKNGIELNWRTETEVNNYGFEIHRSTQKDNWENIGFVEGHGNSNSPQKYSFLDDNVSVSGKYFYRLKQIDNDGSYEYSNVIEINFGTSQDYVLNQNYPNPFNPVTSISFQIPAKSNVTLKVYDIVGKEVATLVDEVKEAGVYIMRFDGSGLASGFYIFKLQANDFVEIRKMVLMK